ncbi:tetratricopeptide repeat protein [Paenibacillus yanchengensis]|uniref:Tetratricopeptide repeat protein n=1 Tax=Paenibacillus yanchengensis TaxID=2035833 RepID=A0ABW4YJL0_9BACL
MFQYMFTTMHEALDQIVAQYNEADEAEQEQYLEQLKELKQVSDTCLEMWLEFEERWTTLVESNQSDEAVNYIQPLEPADTVSNNDNPWNEFAVGRGYYNLFMFREAANNFLTAVEQAPHNHLARLFLGMCYMHLQQWQAAEREFKLLLVLSENEKWLALSYNALGCIAAIYKQLDKAQQLFEKSYQIYPHFSYSLNNLKACQNKQQQLSLYFGSTELCCM